MAHSHMQTLDAVENMTNKPQLKWSNLGNMQAGWGVRRVANAPYLFTHPDWRPYL